MNTRVGGDIGLEVVERANRPVFSLSFFLILSVFEPLMLRLRYRQRTQIKPLERTMCLFGSKTNKSNVMLAESELGGGMTGIDLHA